MDLKRIINMGGAKMNDRGRYEFQRLSAALDIMIEAEFNDDFRIKNLELISQVLQEMIDTGCNPNPDRIKAIYEKLKELLLNEVQTIFPGYSKEQVKHILDSGSPFNEEVPGYI